VTFTLWFIIIGVVFIFMALSSTVLKRLPLTYSILYLGVGLVLGPLGVGFIQLDPVEHAGLLEHITEAALVISLFTSGLKLRTPLVEKRWRLPVRLAVGCMLITICLVAVAGVVGLGLSLGAAILLGAILAPTDPVLAAEVQVDNAYDVDRLRFSLTGEAGLNDGSATPFVLLGLGLLGVHELGELGWQWLAVDVVWGIGAGIGIGAMLGTLVGRLVIYLRREHKHAVGLDDFLGLGLIALSYGVALLVHSYGFLAVFAAGVALRRVERESSGEKTLQELPDLTGVGREEIATDPEKGAVYMVETVLGFNQHLERIAEVAVVLLLGGMISSGYFTWQVLWFIPLLFLVIRPLSVFIGLIGLPTNSAQRWLMGWFGIRGVGSIYYLAYSINHGLPVEMAHPLASLVLLVVAISVVVHGVSVTPLMSLYNRRKRRVVVRSQGDVEGGAG
jgi:NhaP-type Na+/H+ or K+/H+ antiporter